MECKKMKRNSVLILMCLVSQFAVPILASGQHAKTNTRLFWVDQESQQLKWGDVVTTDKWALKTGTVDAFPKTDPATSKIGPLFDLNGLVIAAMSGKQNDEKQNTWIAMDSGVFQQGHGNHFHWKYTGRPSVTKTIAEKQQGENVRIAANGQQLYLLGEKGFTAEFLGNLRIKNAVNSTKRFFPVTTWPVGQLEIVDNVVGYAAWKDKEGERAGQVDVIKMADLSKPAYSFKLPSGDVTSTVVNSAKVFFAHEGAVSWVSPDRSASLGDERVKVNPVVEPTNQPFKPESPSPLINERNWVVFTAGTGEKSKLCMIDAASVNPVAYSLPIKPNDGLRLSAPTTVLSLGKRFAFIFQERIQANSDAKEQLTIVELDPNRDMRFDDARIAITIPIGPSAIKNGTGNHQVCFDDGGRFAVFTNPGDGTLSVMSMHDLKLRVTFKVGGMPSEIIAVGAPEHFH